MSKEQLELDLTNNAAARLQTWVRDTSMRCEAVDLSATRQMAMVTSVLMYQLFHVWEIMEVDPAEAGRITYQAYKACLEMDQQKEKESKKNDKVK